MYFDKIVNKPVFAQCSRLTNPIISHNFPSKSRLSRGISEVTDNGAVAGADEGAVFCAV